MSSFFVQTFGCRCNQADSAQIRQRLCRSSWRETVGAADADLLVVNTCTVTHRTDQQVRQSIRRLHRENPAARLVVTGCYAERDPRTLASIPGVDLVVGNADKEGLAELLAEPAWDSGVRVVQSPLDPARDYLLGPYARTGGKTRPFLKIQDGCDARCSYCIVPAVRGPGRSARPEDIVEEVGDLVKAGYQEIVLTGVHLGTYGMKLAQRTTLALLLRRILELPGLGRLRLSSIEPMRYSRKLLDLACRHANFARHFHIPVQSGSDRVLRKMRRPYTVERFVRLLGEIRSRLPCAGLGTDLMVGFPGESEEDFQHTCALLRESPLNYAHVFPFSARAGTDAWSLPSPVPSSEIIRRARTLRGIAQEKSLSFRKQFLGRTLSALSLAKEEEAGDSVVLTENYIHVRVTRRGLPPNRLVEVRIDEALPHATRGTVE